MLKQMWIDLTTGWGPWQQWVLVPLILGLCLAVVAIPIVGGAVLIGWLTGLGPDFGILCMCGLILLGLWMNSAYERSR